MNGLCVRGKWRPNRTATYWLSLLWPQPRFFPVLLGCLTGDLGAHSARCCFSLPHLISNCNCPMGAWGPTLLGAGFLYRILTPTDWTYCALSYIIVQCPPSSCERHRSHSFNPSTVKVIFWYSSTGCTCYLHRSISYFDCPTGSEVNIKHCYIAILETIELCANKWAQTQFEIICTKCVYKSYLIYMNKDDFALNNLLWLTRPKTQPTNKLFTLKTYPET